MEIFTLSIWRTYVLSKLWSVMLRKNRKKHYFFTLIFFIFAIKNIFYNVSQWKIGIILSSGEKALYLQTDLEKILYSRFNESIFSCFIIFISFTYEWIKGYSILTWTGFYFLKFNSQDFFTLPGLLIVRFVSFKSSLLYWFTWFISYFI